MFYAVRGSGQQYHLAVAVARGQLAIGLANLLQRERARDWYLDASVGHQSRDLRQQWRTGDRVGALPADTQPLHRLEVGDRVDSLRGDPQLDGKVNVAAAERVDECVDPASGRVADPLGLPVAV